MSGRQFRNSVIRYLAKLIDPGICIGCGQDIKPTQNFCTGCFDLLRRVDNPCTICGQKNSTANAVCAVCLFDPPRWQKIVAPMIYQGFGRDLLMSLKYAQSTHIANSLSSCLMDAFQCSHPKPEILLPVPLHHQRLIERGFNQAFEIARVISRQIDIDVDRYALKRIRPTESQFGLSAIQREKNILKAFSFDNRNNYRHVAIVDDIVTTGSTANEITKTLHRAGVTTVEIWGLARVLK